MALPSTYLLRAVLPNLVHIIFFSLQSQKFDIPVDAGTILCSLLVVAAETEVLEKKCA